MEYYVMDDLHQQRDKVIEQILAAYPRAIPDDGRLKIVREGGYEYESEKLQEILGGKRWEEVVNHPHISYFLSEPESIWSLTDEAYIYYLPAYLVTNLNCPGTTFFPLYLFKKIKSLISKFSFEQIDALISYCEDWSILEDEVEYYVEGDLDEILLRLMILRVELESGSEKIELS